MSSEVKPSVAIVTATTGRGTLVQTIASVAAQTYPNLTHYIFVDNPGADLPPGDYEALWLPHPTGKNGLMNGPILGASTFLCTEDFICFLDDDNWIEPDHVESLVAAIQDKAYAYCLRNIMDRDGTFFMRDDGEAIGHHGDLVDMNCFLFKREVAQGVAPLFVKTTGTLNICDRHIWALLREHNTPYATTGKYTVNYRLGGQGGAGKSFFFLRNIVKRSQNPDGFPWRAAG
jgi:glycosyltransferase involved in cell wall biosynthesis